MARVVCCGWNALLSRWGFDSGLVLVEFVICGIFCWWREFFVAYGLLSLVL